MTAAGDTSGAPAARHLILGTAGHVDHGKTELVRALTGHDTDRLKEEKDRGISIELGFAPLKLADDVFVGIIDVPGHEKFVRQMVAGAGGIDLAMLLIAADEGVMPQTREHLEVLRALGVRHGVVVVSKADLATDDMRPILDEDIAELVSGSFLEDSPVVYVSARAGTGLDDLREALTRLALGIDNRDDTGPFRLAIDRVFHQKGIGVVVTGSAYSGRVTVGDELDLLPAGARVRIREIQSFASKRTDGVAGERLALALHGVKLDEVARGDMLVTTGRFAASDVVDVRVALAPGEDTVVKNRERIRIHHGARELLGRVVLLEIDELRAGESTLAQLRLESPMVAGDGDRFVVRKYSPPRVVGGGVVIDPRASAHRRGDASVLERLRVREQGDPETVLARAALRAGMDGIAEGDMDAEAAGALRERGEIVMVAGRGFHRDALDDLAKRGAEIAIAHQRANPLQWGIGKEELRQRLSFPHPAATFNRVVETLAASHPLFVRQDRVRAGSAELELAPAAKAALSKLEAAVRDAGVAFPSRAELERDWPSDLRLTDALLVLRDAGRVVEVGEGVIHAETLDRCIATVRAWFENHDGMSVADFRDGLGITRKHAVPLLELLDARRMTVRRGDIRVPGSGLAGN